MYNMDGSAPVLVGCLFDSNAAKLCGGAIYNVDSKPSIKNTIFQLNQAAYGGAIYNPAQALCEIVAQLKDDRGHITIPGF
jgi:hypothetical protein